MNKSDKRAEKEAKITSNDDIVDKQVDRLKDVKGDLFGKEQTFNQCVDSEDSGFDHEGNMSAIIKLFLA
jgi:F0F1-type ATP synthase delta subunit